MSVINYHVFTYNRGPIWFGWIMCANGGSSYYYDNNPVIFETERIVFATFGLTKKTVYKRQLDYLKHIGVVEEEE